MKIIFNSDVLYHGKLVADKLSRRHEQLFKMCAEKGHTVVIPQTSLLEFDRYQSILYSNEITALKNAYSLLERLGITFKQVEPSEIINKPNLVNIIEGLGATVEVVEPTYEDFIEAHKRACLHEPPQPCRSSAEPEPDEMRDLVIWISAVRIAKMDGHALLVSRDKIHVGSLGNDEATEVGLERIQNIDEVLEYFDVLTPAGSQITRLLEYVWDNLLEKGLPLSKPMSIIGVQQPRFVQGALGPKSINCVIKVKGTGGKIVQAKVSMQLDRGTIEKVIVSDILIEKAQWTKAKEVLIETNKKTDIWSDNYKNRLDALKAALGG